MFEGGNFWAFWRGERFGSVRCPGCSIGMQGNKSCRDSWEPQGWVVHDSIPGITVMDVGKGWSRGREDDLPLTWANSRSVNPQSWMGSTRQSWKSSSELLEFWARPEAVAAPSHGLGGAFGPDQDIPSWSRSPNPGGSAGVWLRGSRGTICELRDHPDISMELRIQRQSCFPWLCHRILALPSALADK